MDTMERQVTAGTADADPGSAVEAVMGKIVVELGAALGVLLTSLGTRSGLWVALGRRRSVDDGRGRGEGERRPGVGP